MNSGIYCIKNIANNKCYIGSSKNIKKRLKEHWYALERKVHKNLHLQAAYNKYGSESFIFIGLEEVEDTELLIDVENWWLSNLEWDELYNIRPDASSSKGKIVSEETRRKLSLAAKGRRRERKPKKVKPRVERVKKEIGHRAKSILQIDKETNEIIKHWNSMLEVTKNLNIAGSSISDVCNHKRKTAGGFIWKFAS